MATALRQQQPRNSFSPRPAPVPERQLPLRATAPPDIRHILRCLCLACALAVVPVVYVNGYSAQTRAMYVRVKLRDRMRNLINDKQRLQEAVNQARSQKAVDDGARAAGMIRDAPTHLVRETADG